jgi:hypothetical protein
MARVIKSDNLPTRLPLISTMTIYLFLDHFNAPEWVWGGIGILLGILWIACVCKFFTDTSIDVLN